MQASRNISAVIFDMDGVLIDSSDAHFESWRRLTGEMGIGLTREQFGGTFGRQNRDIIPTLFGSDLGQQRIDELGETKERYYREIIKDHVPVLPGAAELVRACHDSGLACAVGSSGHPENIAITLRAMGVEDIMGVVVSGHDVSVGKPDPQVFLLAAEGLNVEPKNCVVIEDAPAGIEAALAAGMFAVGLTTEHPRERLARAHRVVDKLAELSPDVLATLHHE